MATTSASKESYATTRLLMTQRMFTPWKLTKPAEISQYMCIFFAKYTHVVTGYGGAFYSESEFSCSAPAPNTSEMKETLLRRSLYSQ